MSEDNNTIVAHGYGGYGHTLKYIPAPGAILLDSGVIHARAPVGNGFDLADFETPLQICPINPHEMKPSFSTKDWEELGLQDSHAFEGKDEEEPDDTYYFSRAVALVTRPPSIWTGKMRLFMQCLYGSHDKKTMNKSLEIVLLGQDNNKSTLGSLRLGTFELSSDVILFTDEVNYRYFLIRISVDSAQIAEIIFDKMGDKVLKKLRGEPDFSQTPLEIVEGFLFSRAKEVKNLQSVTGQFDVSPYGAPLLHWWHGNESGSQACMVPTIITENYIDSCVAELSISKVSEPDTQNTGEWIDTWSFSLNISEQSRCNPRRGFDNLFTNGVPVTSGLYSHGAANAPMYCWYKGGSLHVEPYTCTDTQDIIVDPGWDPAPVFGDPTSWTVGYCGLVNAYRRIEYRYGNQKFGFGDAIIDVDFAYIQEVSVTSSSTGIVSFSSSDASGGCDNDLGEIDGAPGVLTHPAEYYGALATRLEQWRYESSSGMTFMFIPANDAEACFCGKRQIRDTTTPNITRSSQEYIWQIGHYHWKAAEEGDPPGMEHVGDFVGVTKQGNSVVVNDPNAEYIPGVVDYQDSRVASCHLNHSNQAVNTANHDSLYIQPIYGGGSTGFRGYVQQSALTGKAVYSSGDGLAGDAPCGSPMGYYDIFTGLV